MKIFKFALVLALILLFSVGCGGTPPAVDESSTPGEQPAENPVEGEPATSTAAEKVITAVSDPWPPFISEDSPTKGLSMEIISAAFEAEGYTVKLEIVPWARAVDGVKTGEKDILAGVWFTEERAKDFLYGEKFITNEIKFVKKKGDSFEYNGLESLKGKTVGTINGYSYEPVFMDSTGFTKVPVGDTVQNIRKLIEGRIDLTLEDTIVLSALLQKEDPTLLDQIEFTKEALTSNSLCVATGIGNPRSEEIINAYNKGLETIKGNGVYDKILSNYGIEKTEE